MTHVAAALLQRLLPCRAEGPDGAVPFPAAGTLTCTEGVAPCLHTGSPHPRGPASTEACLEHPGSEAIAAASSTMKKVLEVQCARHTTGGTFTRTFRSRVWAAPGAGLSPPDPHSAPSSRGLSRLSSVTSQLVSRPDSASLKQTFNHGFGLAASPLPVVSLLLTLYFYY